MAILKLGYIKKNEVYGYECEITKETTKAILLKIKEYTTIMGNTKERNEEYWIPKSVSKIIDFGEEKYLVVESWVAAKNLSPKCGKFDIRYDSEEAKKATELTGIASKDIDDETRLKLYLEQGLGSINWL